MTAMGTGCARGADEQDRARLWAAVAAHRERLLRLARRRTLTAQDAEDCVQEAMLRAVEFEGLDESRLGPFLTTVTMRLCADRHRERGHDERLRLRLGPGETVTPGPEDDVCDRGEAAWLAACFDQLTPKQQAVVRARQAGLSCAEVAARLRMSYDSVESSLARARSRFREALARTMGVLWPAAWRWTAAVEGAAVTAAVIGGLVAPPAAVSPAPGGVPDTVVALPERAAPVAVTAPRPPVPAARVRPAAALPSTTRTKERSAVRAHTAAKRKPKDKPEPIAGAGGWEVAPDRRNDEFTTQERLQHCLAYGIETTGTIRCRYPPEEQR